MGLPFESLLSGESIGEEILKDLVFSFRPLVESIARRYSLKGGSYEDLRQEGYLTLIKLIRRYRAGKVRLEGYIKGSLEAHIRSYWLKELNWKKGVILSDELPSEPPLANDLVDIPLSDEDRRLLELYYLWGYNDENISRIMGKSRSWVNLRRRRLVEKLRSAHDS